MSTSRRLDRQRFVELLAIHGARAQRWPEALRAPLAELLEQDPEARARWEEASALDAWLDAAPALEPAPALLAQIASLPARHPRAAHAGWWPFGQSFAPLYAWGAAAVLGVLVGMAQAPDLDPSDLGSTDPGAEVSEDLAWSDDTSGDDWDDVDGLVTGDDWDMEDD